MVVPEQTEPKLSEFCGQMAKGVKDGFQKQSFQTKAVLLRFGREGFRKEAAESLCDKLYEQCGQKFGRMNNSSGTQGTT